MVKGKKKSKDPENPPEEEKVDELEDDSLGEVDPEDEEFLADDFDDLDVL